MKCNPSVQARKRRLEREREDASKKSRTASTAQAPTQRAASQSPDNAGRQSPSPVREEPVAPPSARQSAPTAETFRLRHEVADLDQRVAYGESILAGLREELGEARKRLSSAQSSGSTRQSASLSPSGIPAPRLQQSRETVSKDLARRRSQIKYFTYFDCASLPPRLSDSIFRNLQEGEGTQAELYHKIVGIFGSPEALYVENDVQMQFTFYHNRACTKALERIKSCLHDILRIDAGEIKLREKSSEMRRFMKDNNELYWAWDDPVQRSGFLESEFVLETLSALLHGPQSVRRANAKERSASQSHSHYRQWKPRKITANFVAFGCALLYHAIQGHRRFELGETKKKGSNRSRFNIFDNLRTCIESNPRWGGRLLRNLTEALIPDTDEDEHEDEEETQCEAILEEMDIRMMMQEKQLVDEEDEREEAGGGTA
ncbi:uncharacterized protein JCM15063_001192 [Sporobolomyces koalae]|uniref:uncharacterized protein n=1 Tax=Sporobolomyces koalae TaxID=500713 RepID=UPI0031717936